MKSHGGKGGRANGDPHWGSTSTKKILKIDVPPINFGNLMKDGVYSILTGRRRRALSGKKIQ